jgi:hypothetical protein
MLLAAHVISTADSKSAGTAIGGGAVISPPRAAGWNTNKAAGDITSALGA